MCSRFAIPIGVRFGPKRQARQSPPHPAGRRQRYRKEQRDSRFSPPLLMPVPRFQFVHLVASYTYRLTTVHDQPIQMFAPRRPYIPSNSLQQYVPIPACPITDSADSARPRLDVPFDRSSATLLHLSFFQKQVDGPATVYRVVSSIASAEGSPPYPSGGSSQSAGPTVYLPRSYHRRKRPAFQRSTQTRGHPDSPEHPASVLAPQPSLRHTVSILKEWYLPMPATQYTDQITFVHCTLHAAVSPLLGPSMHLITF